MATEKFYQKFTEPKKTKKDKKNLKKEEFYKNSKPLVKKDRDEAPKKTFVPVSPFEVLNHQFDIGNVPEESKKVLLDFDQVVQGVRPLNSKQLMQLPDNIKNLSHQLTDMRSERRLGYMNENVQLSAYVRYYTWWNLVRLTRLFANLPSESFPKNDTVCLDCGSGPLTVISALWLARPELRKLNLTWYCLDVSSNSMAFGEDIYLSLAAKITGKTWKIIRVKGPFGTFIKEKASFITCANMLNELDQASDMPPEFQTKKYFEQFQAYASEKCKFLLIEPGVPKASRTLSLLRERFINKGNKILSPCPHAGECPMNGFKAYTGSQNKWCNFAFSTEDAPAKLLKLSEKAKLPKERATLAFLSVSDEIMTEAEKSQKIKVRIASDPLKIPGCKTGFYGCSALGLTLVKVMSEQSISSGDMLEIEVKNAESLALDQKSGAKTLVI